MTLALAGQTKDSGVLLMSDGRIVDPSRGYKIMGDNYSKINTPFPSVQSMVSGHNETLNEVFRVLNSLSSRNGPDYVASNLSRLCSNLDNFESVRRYMSQNDIPSHSDVSFIKQDLSIDQLVFSRYPPNPVYYNHIPHFFYHSVGYNDLANMIFADMILGGYTLLPTEGILDLFAFVIDASAKEHSCVGGERFTLSPKRITHTPSAKNGLELLTSAQKHIKFTPELSRRVVSDLDEFDVFSRLSAYTEKYYGSEMSIKYLEQYLMLIPTETKPRRLTYHDIIIEPLFHTRDYYREAISRFERVMNNHPKIRTWVNRAKITVANMEDNKRLSGDVLSRIEADARSAGSDNPEYLSWLGKAYQLTGNSRDSISSFNKTVQLLESKESYSYPHLYALLRSYKGLYELGYGTQFKDKFNKWLHYMQNKDYALTLASRI